jgi:hypothetical protein
MHITGDALVPVLIHEKRGSECKNVTTVTMDPKASSNSRRSTRSNGNDKGMAIDAATDDVTIEPIAVALKPKGSKRIKNDTVDANIGPVRKRPKVKLEQEIRPDAPPPPDQAASLRAPDYANSEPVPDAATSLSNVAAMSTEGRAIVHMEHRTGNVLDTYKSCFAAAKSVGISRHIVDSLVKGIYKANHHKGAAFRYATNEEQAAFASTEANRNNIEQIDVASGKVMATFPSVLVASNKTGVGRKDISSMLKGKLESKNGWTFRYPILPDIFKSEPADDVGVPGTDSAKDDVEDAKTRVSARNKIMKAPVSDKPDTRTRLKVGKKSKASKEEIAANKSKTPADTDQSEDVDWPDDIVEDSGIDVEPTEYEEHEIIVTEHGSLGILARKTKASEAVLSMVTLFDGDCNDKMNLQIASFIGKDSIAERFGMRVGDFLFLSVSSLKKKNAYGGNIKQLHLFNLRVARMNRVYKKMTKETGTK